MTFEMSLLFKSYKQADKGVFYFQILAESLVDNKTYLEIYVG